MSSPQGDLLRRTLRWLVPGALLALAPKCVLCLMAYTGLGAAFGIGGAELCGAPIDTSGNTLAWLLGPVLVSMFVFTRQWLRTRGHRVCLSK